MGIVSLWFADYIPPTIIGICLLIAVYFLILAALNEQGYKLERKYEDEQRNANTTKF